MLKKYFYFILLLIIIAFNSFTKIGIIEDGNHHLLDAVLTDNCIVGHEGFSGFPFNSRMFPTYLPHICVGLAKILNIYDIDVLSSLFTFVVYFVPIILLIFILLNIPKNKKENFEIILLSFLICFLFMEYHICTENINTGLFLWVLFVIYYYVDFDKLSKFNIFSILFFSFVVISSHPMVIAFSLPFILFGMKKLFVTTNIDIKRKLIVVTSLCLLLYTFAFNLYYLYFPIALPDDYFSFKVFLNFQFIIFLFSIISILTLSFFNGSLSKKLFVLFLCIILYVSVFKIKSSIGYSYRTLGFYIPIMFMLFIIFKDRYKLSINYKYLKILNYILIVIILCNSIYIGLIWNTKINYLKEYSQKYATINFDNYLNMLPNVHHKSSLLMLFLMITHKNNSTLIIDLKKYSHKDYVLLPGSIELLKNNRNKLTKFNINTDKIISINN